MVWAGPSVSQDGKVLVLTSFHRQVVKNEVIHHSQSCLYFQFIGSGDDKEYAIRTDSGALLWKFVTNGSVMSNPTVNNNSSMVYTG